MKETCATVMTKKPACCVPEDTVQRAAKLMRDLDVGSIPVCETHDGKKLSGIVTDRDLALKIIADGRDPATSRLSDVMTRQVLFCRPEDDLEAALETMEHRQVRRIPVVEQDGRLVGIIAQADIATRLNKPEKIAEVVSEISKPSPVAV